MTNYQGNDSGRHQIQAGRATVFSVLDMNEAYRQLELDEDSRHLKTFYGTSTKLRYTSKTRNTACTRAQMHVKFEMCM